MSKTNDKNTVKEFNSFKPSIKSEIYCRLTNNTLLNYKANKPALNIVNYNGVTVGIYMDFKNIDIVISNMLIYFL